MALAVIQEQTLTDIADSIRAKNGSSDTYTPSQMAGAIADLPSGSTDHGGKYWIRVVDCDGTIIKQDHLNTGDTFDMPQPPTHDRLVFQEWSSPVTITNGSFIVGHSDITIGPLYNTLDGRAEFDVAIRGTVPQTIYCAMVGDKDWGDGTTDALTEHSYANEGDYVIKCDGTELPSNCFADPNDVDAPQLAIVGIRLGLVTTIRAGSIQELWCVDGMVASTSLYTVENGAYYTPFGLKTIIIPQTATIQGLTFLAGYFTSAIILPNNSQISGNLFSEMPGALSSFTLPNNATSYACMTAYLRVKHIFFPPSISTIPSSAIIMWLGCLEYDFSQHQSIPIIQADSFQSLNPSARFIVPDALYDQWIVATNWAALASQIVKASEV